MTTWIYITNGFALSLPSIIILALWSLFWKGLALWHSARRNDPGWFAAILVVNTVGILEIVYLFVVLKLNRAALFSRGPAVPADSD